MDTQQGSPLSHWPQLPLANPHLCPVALAGHEPGRASDPEPAAEQGLRRLQPAELEPPRIRPTAVSRALANSHYTQGNTRLRVLVAGTLV